MSASNLGVQAPAIGGSGLLLPNTKGQPAQRLAGWRALRLEPQRRSQTAAWALNLNGLGPGRRLLPGRIESRTPSALRCRRRPQSEAEGPPGKWRTGRGSQRQLGGWSVGLTFASPARDPKRRGPTRFRPAAAPGASPGLRIAGQIPLGREPDQPRRPLRFSRPRFWPTGA